MSYTFNPFIGNLDSVGDVSKLEETYTLARTSSAFWGPAPYRQNLFSRVLTNDTAVYKGTQVLNNWLTAENGLYYHPLYYYNTEISQTTSIEGNFGMSYNFVGQFTYILSATNTIVNNNFDFDLISNIQYVDSNRSFLIGDGYGYRVGNSINALLSSGNQFYIGGFINYFNDGASPNGIVRINLNGSQDYTFFNHLTGLQIGAIGAVYSLERDSNNKILVGGSFGAYNGRPASNFTRINSNGTFDTTLSAVTGLNLFNSTVQTIVPQTDGKILVGGDYSLYNGQPNRCFIRLNYDGSIDTSLSAVPGSSRFFMVFGSPASIRTIVAEPDGKIAIGGYFAIYNGETHNQFIRLNTDGSIDTSLSAVAGSSRFAGIAAVNRIIKGLNNTYILGGTFVSYNSQTHQRFIRLNYDGSIDTSLSAVAGANRFNSDVLDIVLQPDNKILVVGNFTSYFLTTYNRIIRLNYDGSIDTSFTTGTGFDGTVNKILLLSNGKILVGGGFNMYNGETVRGIALLNSNGTLDTSSQTRFIERVRYKAISNPGAVSFPTNIAGPEYENLANLFVPTIQNGQICIGSVQPLIFGTVDYTLLSNYGSGTIGFGTS